MQFGAHTAPTLHTTHHDRAAWKYDFAVLGGDYMMFLGPRAARMTRCDGMWKVSVGPKPFSMGLSILSFSPVAKWKRSWKVPKVHPS